MATIAENKLTALYGIFNYDMEPIDTIYATNAVEKLTEGDYVTIPAGLNFSAVFGNVKTDKRKTLQINTAGNIYNIADVEYPDTIRLNTAYQSKHIRIVYYLYANPNSNWRGIISGQLLQLKGYGILSEAHLYIHITDCYGLANPITELIKEIAPNAVLSYNYENQYEYPGIKLIHSLATQYPEDTFIYFHAKGMSHNIHSRLAEEVTLFTKTFQDWRRNIQLLNKNGICKIGLFPAVLHEKKPCIGDTGGWIWYNYWYATGKYLSNCPEPVLTTDKYYYEGWLAIQNSETLVTNDCLSLYEIKNVSKNYFTPTEADYHLNIPSKKSLTLTKRVIQALGSSAAAHYYFQTRLNVKSLFKKR